MIGRRALAALTGLAALGSITGLGVTLAPSASAAVVGGMKVLSTTASAATVDVSVKSVAVTVTAHVTKPVGVTRLILSTTYTPDPTSQERGGDTAPGAVMSLVSGTATDGVFSGSLSLPVGTRGRFDLGYTDQENNQDWDRWRTDQLRAAGLTDHVSTVTTKVPAALTNVKGSTATVVRNIFQGSPLYYQYSLVTYTAGTGTQSVVVQSASASCGTVGANSPWSNPAYGQLTLGPRTAGICTASIRPLNAAGYGPVSSVTFW